MGEGGWRARREERMAERGSTGTHKNVPSTPAPPVIGSNHRGSHASSFLTSRKSATDARIDEAAEVNGLTIGETRGPDRNIW